MFVLVTVLYSLSEKPDLPEMIIQIDFMYPIVWITSSSMDACIILADVVMSACFLVKLRKISATAMSSSSKLANTVVMYQIIMQAVFWIAPTLIKVAMDKMFATNIEDTLGPVALTGFVIYVACCSLLYWKKLASKRAVTTGSG